MEFEDDIIDGFDALRQMYEGKEVEGEVLPEFVAHKETVFKEIVFSLDGKKYKFVVEKVQE